MLFNEATAVQQVDSHTYTANLDGEWVIGTVPHGGYVTSIFQQVIRKHFSTTLKGQNQPHPLTLHLDFLRRTQTGPATFKVKDVKLGRQTSTVHVSLTQEGDSREEVVGYFNNTNIAAESGVSYPTTWQLQPPTTRVQDFAALLRDEDPYWGERHKWPRTSFRKATGHLRTWFPREGLKSRSFRDMWYHFRDDSTRFTNESLGFVCDSFPQMLEAYFLESGEDIYGVEFERKYSPERQKQIAGEMPRMWYPTLLMNIEVKKALPEEGVEFLFLRLETKLIRNGRYDLEVIVMDAGMDLVAISHHVVFAVGIERNTAKRRTAEGGASDSKL